MAGSKQSIAVRGAGVAGLWQALTLARAGHAVTLYERSSTPFAQACSPYAGAMLAPRCEEESAESLIRELGLRGIALWRKTYPGTIANGSLVVALPRDRALLDRFARMTAGFERLGATELGALEPDLGPRFSTALYYPDEAHVPPERRLPICSTRRSAPALLCVSAKQARPRTPTSSSTAVGSPRGRNSERYAACAASGSWCGAARWRSRDRCGCCTHAFPSTSCPGTKAAI